MTVRSNYHTLREYHDSYIYKGKIRNYIECSQVHVPFIAVLQPRRSYVAQAKYCNSFQLTHMPRGNHPQSIASNGDQKEDKTLLQHSQLSQHGEFRHVSVSERQRSRPCGQNLRVPFPRAVLTPEVEESARAMVTDGETKAFISLPPR